jgi:hypothetical protein
MKKSRKEENRKDSKRSERSIALDTSALSVSGSRAMLRASAIALLLRMCKAVSEQRPHDMFLSFATVASRFVSKSEFALLVAFHLA